MIVNLTGLQVMHLQEKQRFEIHVDGYIAELTYRLHDDTIIFLHTEVPPALEGQGIGTRLVKAGLDYACTNALEIKSLCWFVTRYLQRHPEYQT